jgi:hypothetical protein
MRTWEDQIILYKLEIGERTPQQLGENTPGAYRVVKSDTASGVVIYGRYGEKWVENPGTRELIAHLLRMIKGR